MRRKKTGAEITWPTVWLAGFVSVPLPSTDVGTFFSRGHGNRTLPVDPDTPSSILPPKSSAPPFSPTFVSPLFLFISADFRACPCSPSSYSLSCGVCEKNRRCGFRTPTSSCPFLDPAESPALVSLPASLEEGRGRDPTCHNVSVLQS